MAKVLVKLYTTLKDRLRTPNVWLDGATAADLIEGLKKVKSPDVENILLDERGLVRSHFVVTLNSEILDHKKLAAAKVKDGDVLHIFPPVSGG